MWPHLARGSAGLEGRLRMASVTCLVAGAGSQVGGPQVSMASPHLRLDQLPYMVVPGQHFKRANMDAVRTRLGSHTLLLLLNATG